MTLVPQSPYARALGDRISELHPELQRYIVAIPEGCVGIGDGVFRRVGSPHRWLWPLLRVMQQRGIVFAGWEADVPFRLTNRTITGRTIGECEFRFDRGLWTMPNAATLTRYGRVVDELGDPGTVATSFTVDVQEAALVLTSHAVGIRLGGLRIRLPRLLSPVVLLTDRFDEELNRLRIELTITAPVIGRVYEYSGDFSYRVEEATP